MSLAPLAAVAVVAAAAPTPVQLYTSSLAAARAQHSVHYVAATVFPGRAVTIVGDAAADRGSQRITVRQGTATGHVTVLVVANVAYVRGDARTLHGYMGFTAADATRYAGRWLSIRPSQAAFKPVAEAVRLASTIDELEMPPPFSATAPTTVAGQRVDGVRAAFTHGGQKVVETLYVRASGSPLPVEQVGASGSGTRLSTTFSRWNEAVRVTKPAGAIPLP